MTTETPKPTVEQSVKYAATIARSAKRVNAEAAEKERVALRSVEEAIRATGQTEEQVQEATADLFKRIISKIRASENLYEGLKSSWRPTQAAAGYKTSSLNLYNKICEMSAASTLSTEPSLYDRIVWLEVAIIQRQSIEKQLDILRESLVDTD